MKLREALEEARKILAQGTIEDAPLEGELLLRHTLKISRAQLYSDPERELSPEEERTFFSFIKRRLNHEPTAYITRSREFFGLDFYVDKRVLIPRPESELLVEEALKLANLHQLATIADIGTGCGAIAICLALKLPQSKIYATDISREALEVARINCERYGVLGRVELLQGDLLNPLPERVELVIANLPYVASSELSRIPSKEPSLALDGGEKGLEKISRLIKELKDKLKEGGFLLLEIGFGQAKEVRELLKDEFPWAKVETVPDLGGIERVIRMSQAVGALSA